MPCEFSIIIPLYNKENTIKNCIDSVLNQSYTGWELIIINDGSTDNSISIINSYNDPRILCYSQSNSGPSSARNYGIKKSTKEWILFLDADDLLEPESLLHFSLLIQKYPQCFCFSCNFYFDYGTKRNIFNKHSNEHIVTRPFIEWACGTFLPRAGASVFKRSVLNAFRYKENLRRFEDAEMLFRLMRNFLFVYSPFVVLSYNCKTAEASLKRMNIKEDFCAYLDPKGKSFEEKIVLYQLYRRAKELYKGELTEIYPHGFSGFFVKLGYFACRLWSFLKRF